MGGISRGVTGGISRGVRGISQGVGRFHRSTRHPIWPLSNSDSVYFRIVLHLRRELTDPPSRVAAGVGGQVQYRWHEQVLGSVGTLGGVTRMGCDR